MWSSYLSKSQIYHITLVRWYLPLTHSDVMGNLSPCCKASTCCKAPTQDVVKAGVDGKNLAPRLHKKCLNTTYPRTKDVQRFRVPDNKVPWIVPFQEKYSPVSYTSPSVSAKPVWADIDLEDPENKNIKPLWNNIDGKVDRRSHHGPYDVGMDGLPRNPVGRTGICSRGTLGRWGPNHAADPIVTRWKRTSKGSIAKDKSTGKSILQFVAIQRKDTKEWAIPGGMVDPGEAVTVTLKREFGEEASNSLEATEKEKKQIKNSIDALFSKGNCVYKGYVDDPRNTDNSWMETVAMNFHDENGDSVGKIALHAGDDAVGVKWTDISEDLKLFASHAEFVKIVADMHEAHWIRYEQTNTRNVGIFKALFGRKNVECPKPETHNKCRNSLYPRTIDRTRFEVLDDKVQWYESFEGYEPVPFTSPSVSAKPVWADIDLEDPENNYIKPRWNAIDGKVDRRSHNGPYGIGRDGLPRNPVGRTGICSRGTLGRWGPNHAADPIVTRWKRTPEGMIFKDNSTGKKVLQFVAIQRKDTKEWAIPGGMVDPGEAVTVTLKREFGEEALNSLEATYEQKKQIKISIDALFSKGTRVYKGYVDDPRNTDNSWMETVAMNFHDEKGDGVGSFALNAGDDAVGVKWTDIGEELKLFASHAEFVKIVADMHKAHWVRYEQVPETHIKCRSPFYLKDGMKRFPVPDDKVKWKVKFPEYKSVQYTTPSVLKQPIWADIDLHAEVNKKAKQPKWNSIDGKVDRRSFHGKYEVKDGVPLNPVGRTGICDRGKLGRWGPNHAADPIVTRWKRGECGMIVSHEWTGNNILQFVAIKRKDTGEWAIPGGMVDAGEEVSVTLKREFGEEALNSLEATEEKKKQIQSSIDSLFNRGQLVYRGYVDDPRNTDNSWMETVAMNFHDDKGDSVGQIPLHAGDDAVGVQWTDINEDLKLFASHAEFVKKVAHKHKAHWGYQHKAHWGYQHKAHWSYK